MTDAQRLHEGTRVKQYDQLSAQLQEIWTADHMLKDRPEFTMNTSQIRRITRITIEFDRDSVVLNFEKAEVKGWAVQRALRSVIGEIETQLIAARKEV